MPENLAALVARVAETEARVGHRVRRRRRPPRRRRRQRRDHLGRQADDPLLAGAARGAARARPSWARSSARRRSTTTSPSTAVAPIMWKTGHSLIKTKMKQEHALLAGEMSGHLFFADRFYGYDDAIYASLRLLEILAKDPRSLAEMLADVPRTFATPELRVDCPDAIKFDVVAAVREHYEKAGRPVVDIDGARISFGTQKEPAWGLVRASNTGPVLVLRFEATTPERRDAIRAEVEKVVSRARAHASGRREHGAPKSDAGPSRTSFAGRPTTSARAASRARGSTRSCSSRRRSGRPASSSSSRPSKPLDAEELARFRELVKRRRAREPIAYILGVREFYGRPFRVDSPRARAAAGHRGAGRRGARAHARASRCRCGRSTCARAAAASPSRSRASGPRRSSSPPTRAPTPSRRARQRAAPRRVRVAFRAGRPVRRRRPGVSVRPRDGQPACTSRRARSRRCMPDVRDFEPRQALEGGPDGLDLLRRVVAGAPGAPRDRRASSPSRSAPARRPAVGALRARRLTAIEIRRDYAPHRAGRERRATPG